MNIEHLKDNGTDIAVISSDEKLIVDVQSYTADAIKDGLK